MEKEQGKRGSEDGREGGERIWRRRGGRRKRRRERRRRKTWESRQRGRRRRKRLRSSVGGGGHEAADEVELELKQLDGKVVWRSESFK